MCLQVVKEKPQHLKHVQTEGFLYQASLRQLQSLKVQDQSTCKHKMKLELSKRSTKRCNFNSEVLEYSSLITTFKKRNALSPQVSIMLANIAQK